MTLKIYGTTVSRAMRTFWMAEELGLSYEQIPTDFAKDTKAPEFLALNPQGQVPVIDDDGFVLCQSMAINLYLAKKAGGDLAPKDIEEDALMTQWSFWVMTEVEKPLLNLVLMHPGVAMMPPNEELARQSTEQLQRPLGARDKVLEGKDALVGGRVTVADINVAGVMAWNSIAKVDLSGFPNVSRWLEAMLSRPALAAARQSEAA